MNFSKIELPSNRKFGFFFTFVFGIFAVYFLTFKEMIWVFIIFVLASLIFLIITLVKNEILLPLNKLWMKFGILLGMIVSPIIMGIIFFGLFTPIAILMKLINRDQLRLKLKYNKSNFWIVRSEPINSKSFKNQF